MDKLFELSATLTLDAQAFMQGLLQAQSAAHASAEAIMQLQERISRSWVIDRLLSRTTVMTLDASQLLSALSQVRQAASDTLNALQRLQNVQSVSTAMPAYAGQTDRAAPGFATGITYVPYNDFPARLHEGEAVLTALEAARWRSADAPRPAVDLSAVGEAISDALSGITVQLDGQTVGQLVAPTVSRQIAHQAQSRRYSV